jgi:hypothetical protein
MGASTRTLPSPGWCLALIGLFLGLFGLVALSGPGRIDIVDGQTRFEAARSLVDHGDLAIRDDRVWFNVFPGRHGERHTWYRLPQIVLGAAAIVAADFSGPPSEGRRHFFFSLTSAVAAAALGPLYALWFRVQGWRPAAAILLGAVGVLCNPSWFYGTSTFDDIFGALTLTAAVVVGVLLRDRPTLSALTAGLLAGAAVQCKEPLGAFIPLALAASHRPGAGRRALAWSAVWLGPGLALSAAVYFGLDLYRFPLDARAGHAAYQARYVEVWPGHPVMATLALLVSPGASVFLYDPPALLGLWGLARWARRDRFLVGAFVAGALVFGGFIASLAIFKGDPAWGPRYLTPVLALLWLFAAEIFAQARWRAGALLVGIGLAVQLLSLGVDPHRLLVEHRLPNMWTAVAPEGLFHPGLSHLAQRPREIIAVVKTAGQAPEFSPAWAPTAAPPLAEQMGPGALERYQILSSPRPWWLVQRYLPHTERPVPLLATLGAFAAVMGLGLLLVLIGLGRR